VTIGLVHITLPLMVLSSSPCWRTSTARLAEAAESLGHRSARDARIIFPLSLPGIRSGIAAGVLLHDQRVRDTGALGGNRVSTVSTMIYQKFTFSANWPVGGDAGVHPAGDERRRDALHSRVFREERAV
jgi:ABC-type spermidine/putrescine transport system permease subunit I